MTKVWRKLRNPYALVAQGFILGGLLFFAINGESIAAPAAAMELINSAQSRF
jgi:hypothetical protein